MAETLAAAELAAEAEDPDEAPWNRDPGPATAPLALLLIAEPAQSPDKGCEMCHGTGVTGPHEGPAGGRWIMRTCYACTLAESPPEPLVIPIGLREIAGELRRYLGWARRNRRGVYVRGRHHRGQLPGAMGSPVPQTDTIPGR